MEKIKGLYIAFQPLVRGTGISDKIVAECEGLRNAALDMDFCYQIKDGDVFNYYLNNKPFYSIGKGFKAHIGLYYNYGPIYEYIKENKISFVYIRYIQIANPFFNSFIRKIKKSGAVVYLEIPTYPYDGEYTQGILKNLQKKIEKRYRSFFKKYVDRIVTFTDKSSIFGIPSVNISNGLDMEKVPVRKEKKHSGINLVGVAMLSKWHGFDRIIEGMHTYYQNGGNEQIHFYIIGGGDTIISEYSNLVEKYKLGENVHFEGIKSGRELDPYFDNADIAIGCLACHRKNVKSVKSLKNVEYAARGIVFTYSEDNADFDNSPYVLKQKPDETPIDINALISFVKECKMTPSEIRKTVEERLSWNYQMKIVAESINLL